CRRRWHHHAAVAPAPGERRPPAPARGAAARGPAAARRCRARLALESADGAVAAHDPARPDPITARSRCGRPGPGREAMRLRVRGHARVDIAAGEACEALLSIAAAIRDVPIAAVGPVSRGWLRPLP